MYNDKHVNNYSVSQAQKNKILKKKYNVITNIMSQILV